jgi:hypothetical protein
VTREKKPKEGLPTSGTINSKEVPWKKSFRNINFVLAKEELWKKCNLYFLRLQFFYTIH